MDELSDFLDAVRADELSELVRFVTSSAYCGKIPEPLAFSVVIDTNAVLTTLRWRAQNKSRSALEELLAAGILTLYAPTQLQAEVEKHITTIAHKYEISESHLQMLWSDAKHSIRFVDVSAEDAQKAGGYFRVRDPSDGPFLSAYQKVGAQFIYTRDKDLLATDAPTVAVLDPFLLLRQFARAHARELKLAAMGGVSTHLAAIVVRGLLTLVKTKPRTAMALAWFAVLLWWMSRDPSRSRAKGRPEVICVLGELLARHKKERQAALEWRGSALESLATYSRKRTR